MSFFKRVLGTSTPGISINELLTQLNAKDISAEIYYEPDEFNDREWTTIQVANGDHGFITEIMQVTAADTIKLILDDQKNEIRNCPPVTAAKWLSKYFDKVKVIYIFEMYPPALYTVNYDIIEVIKAIFLSGNRGIQQEDNEGYTNEDGHLILWQFPGELTGERKCAVKNWLGQWQSFTIDLADTTQTDAFKNGSVPKKSKRQ